MRIRPSSLKRLYQKMLASYKKKKEDEEVRKMKKREKVEETSPRTNTLLTEVARPDIPTYYQMKKNTTAGAARPPSEIGSIRSYRSVLTVEEQVNSLESRFQALNTSQEETKAEVQKTQQMVAQILIELRNNRNPAK